MAIQLEEERLVKIRDVLKELPQQHYKYNLYYNFLTPATIDNNVAVDGPVTILIMHCGNLAKGISL